MGGNEFSVPGTTIIFKDKNHSRGELTSLLMIPTEKSPSLDYSKACEIAGGLISLGINFDQLKFVIYAFGQTPKEAVKFVSTAENLETVKEIMPLDLDQEALGIAINTLNKTPKEAVKFVQDPSNELLLIGYKAQGKGRELPDRFQ